MQSNLEPLDECYNFIAVYHLRIKGKLFVINPKGLISIHKEKAEGAMKWWRRIVADKRYPCFYYDSSEESIFNEHDDEVNEEKVCELIKRFGGYIPGTDEDPFNLEKHRPEQARLERW